MSLAANHRFPHEARAGKKRRGKRRTAQAQLERVKQLVIQYEGGGCRGPCRSLVSDLNRVLRAG